MSNICVLIILVALLLLLGGYYASPENISERFTAPFPMSKPPSVYSSLPPQHAQNSAWKYLAPFQKGCLTNDCQTKCSPNQKLVCQITPHNQRVCQWE